MRRRTLALCLTLLTAPLGAHAADFWVATTGSDSNAGTQAAPFLTIQHADNAAVSGFGAGSAVHVAPGAYKGQLSVTTNGSAASPITYLCDVKWSCVIQPATGDTQKYGVNVGGGGAATTSISAISNSSGLVEVTTSAATSLVTGQCGVLVQSVATSANANGRWCITVIDSTHFTLNGSVFEATAAAGGQVRTGWSGAYTTFDGFELNGTWPGSGQQWFQGFLTNGVGDIVRNSKIHEIAYPPGSNNGASGGGCIEDGDGYYGGSVQQIYNNLVYHCGPLGTSQSLIHGIYDGAYGSKIYNNIVWGVSGVCFEGWHEQTNGQLVNNTMWGCLNAGINVGDGNNYAFLTKTGTPTNSSAIITGLNTTSDLVVGMGVEDATHASCIGNGGYYHNTISSIDSSSQIHITPVAGTTCASGDTLQFAGPATSMSVRNNIAYGVNSGDQGIAEFGTVGSNTYTNNNVYNAATAWSLEGSNTHTADQSTNPSFVQYALDGSGDYHLGPGSPDIANGTATNAPAYDFDLNPIPLGASPDIGAYAYNPHPHGLVDKFRNWLAGGYSSAYHKSVYAASTTTTQGTNNVGGEWRVFDLDGVGDVWLNGGLVVGWPASGNCGQGCINAQSLEVNGVALAPSPVPNPLVNASMDFDQQLAAAATSYSVNNTGTVVNTLDGWNAKAASAASGLGVQQQAGGPTGFAHFLRATVGTGSATVNAGDYFILYQPVEAYNITNFGFGGSGAQPLCLGFESEASVANAVVGGAVQNAAQTRSYPFIFVESPTPNTWQVYTVCLAGDNAGTWVANSNAEGLRVVFALEAGTTFQTATVATAGVAGVPGSTFPAIAGAAGAWAGANDYGSSALTQLSKTTGATFDLVGVQLEQSSIPTPFRRPTQAQETEQVQRYAFRLAEPAASVDVGSCEATGTAAQTCRIPFLVQMRAPPGACSITTGTFKENLAGTATTWTSPTAGTNTQNAATITSSTTGDSAGHFDMLQGGGGSGVVYCSARL